MATYLTRTPSSSGSNTTWTFSCWFKKASIGLDTVPFATGYTSPQIDEAMINIGADDQLRFNIAINDTTDVTVKSSRKLRDTSGWYHIVVACDTTQATASDRIKFYFNGELETNLSNTDYPTQNQSTFFGDTNKTQEIGRQPRSSNYLFGVMSHVHFTDGTAYDASTFGEYDANGVWTIKTSPSVTYGTNGFFILKDGNSVTDQSGNSNNWTVGAGTLTKTEDCPSNVFATLNPLVPHKANLVFTNGNTKLASDGGAVSWSTRIGVSTLGMSSGKYYAEAKVDGIGSNQMYAIALLQNLGTFTPSSSIGVHGVGYFSTGSIYRGSASQTGLATYTTGDIIGLAFDATNGTAQWYKNGSAVGNPETGLSTDGFWHFASNFYDTGTISLNFGNGYFGTTAVSSAGTNASGNGIFEYDVPTGYTALSTKGLNL